MADYAALFKEMQANKLKNLNYKNENLKKIAAQQGTNALTLNPTQTGQKALSAQLIQTPQQTSLTTPTGFTYQNRGGEAPSTLQDLTPAQAKYKALAEQVTQNKTRALAALDEQRREAEQRYRAAQAQVNRNYDIARMNSAEQFANLGINQGSAAQIALSQGSNYAGQLGSVLSDYNSQLNALDRQRAQTIADFASQGNQLYYQMLSDDAARADERYMFDRQMDYTEGMGEHTKALDWANFGLNEQGQKFNQAATATNMYGFTPEVYAPTLGVIPGTETAAQKQYNRSLAEQQRQFDTNTELQRQAAEYQRQAQEEANAIAWYNAKTSRMNTTSNANRYETEQKSGINNPVINEDSFTEEEYRAARNRYSGLIRRGYSKQEVLKKIEEDVNNQVIKKSIGAAILEDPNMFW